MKKLLFILAFAFTLQIAAQDQSNWITDNKVALQQSETQNKPILVFVTDNQKSEALKTLELFLSNDSFNTIKSKLVLLKLDISDQQSYNIRLGIHYTKQTGAPGLALIDKNGKPVIEPIVEMTHEDIMTFMTLLHDKF